MNWDEIEGNWNQVKSKVTQQWDKLSDDQLDLVSGKRERLVDKIQECYGVAWDEAERQVTAWEAQYGDMFAKPRRRMRKNSDSAQH